MQENVVFVRWFTRITHALHNDMYDKFKHHLWPLGSSAPEPVAEEEDDGAELEEEELEPVQVSETEFNFLDFIKRWAKSAEVKLSLAVEHVIRTREVTERSSPLVSPSSQVCQPEHRSSVPHPPKILLEKPAPHQPLYRSDAAPSGCWPQDGRLTLSAVGL